MNKLYIKGEILEPDSKAIAVVGSRKMSVRGELLAKEFTAQIVKSGFTIVSGLARGIDTVAHKTALECGGRTIAVLGSGLDVIYPPENFDLAQRITRNGALVSIFPNGTKPYPKNFLARNRVVASLSNAVLVIEGEARSGTLSTASWAANQGVDVFAIPGSPATDFLIGEGAYRVANPKDLLDILL
jgi:DNA processing protein